jgi:hypothetical protein
VQQQPHEQQHQPHEPQQQQQQPDRRSGPHHGPKRAPGSGKQQRAEKAARKAAAAAQLAANGGTHAAAAAAAAAPTPWWARGVCGSHLQRSNRAPVGPKRAARLLARWRNGHPGPVRYPEKVLAEARKGRLSWRVPAGCRAAQGAGATQAAPQQPVRGLCAWCGQCACLCGYVFWAPRKSRTRVCHARRRPHSALLLTPCTHPSTRRRRRQRGPPPLRQHRHRRRCGCCDAARVCVRVCVPQRASCTQQAQASLNNYQHHFARTHTLPTPQFARARSHVAHHIEAPQAGDTAARRVQEAQQHLQQEQQVRARARLRDSASMRQACGCGRAFVSCHDRVCVVTQQACTHAKRGL